MQQITDPKIAEGVALALTALFCPLLPAGHRFDVFDGDDHYFFGLLDPDADYASEHYSFDELGRLLDDVFETQGFSAHDYITLKEAAAEVPPAPQEKAADGAIRHLSGLALKVANDSAHFVWSFNRGLWARIKLYTKAIGLDESTPPLLGILDKLVEGLAEKVQITCPTCEGRIDTNNPEWDAWKAAHPLAYAVLYNVTGWKEDEALLNQPAKWAPVMAMFNKPGFYPPAPGSEEERQLCEALDAPPPPDNPVPCSDCWDEYEEEGPQGKISLTRHPDWTATR